MPSVRVERLPIQLFGLGVLGFDHLQLVYQPRSSTQESDWFVIEGVREPGAGGVHLAVEGRHGGTTLAEANGGAYGAELEAKIGTAATRGSIEIASGRAATRLWAMLTARALDIDSQNFPYIAYALPSSPLPSVNSSSLVSSLLHDAGIDVERAKPRGLRLSPGMETLLGSSGDDVLAITKGFSALLGGAGSDWLRGGSDSARVDKLYGGKDDDRLLWSAGTNIVHGGQPDLAYADDGTDTADYSGAGQVTIRAIARPVPHLVPDYVATFREGEDRLFSVEEIVWNGAGDRIVLEDGADLIEIPFTLIPEGEGEGRGDTIDFSSSTRSLAIRSLPDGSTSVAGAGPHAIGGPGLALSSVERLVGSAWDDDIRAGSHIRSIDGGPGNDIIDSTVGKSPVGFDLEINGGPGHDTLISGAGRTLVRGGEGDDIFVLGPATTELVIGDAEAADRLLLGQHDTLRFELQRGDLLLHVGREDHDEGTATVRILGFQDNDLGISLADPALPIIPSVARGLPAQTGLTEKVNAKLIYPQSEGVPHGSRPLSGRREPLVDGFAVHLGSGAHATRDEPPLRGGCVESPFHRAGALDKAGGMKRGHEAGRSTCGAP